MDLITRSLLKGSAICCSFVVYDCKNKQQTTEKRKIFVTRNPHIQAIIRVYEKPQKAPIRSLYPEVVRFKSHPRNQRNRMDKPFLVIRAVLLLLKTHELTFI